MAVTDQKSAQLQRVASNPGDGSQSSAGIQVAPFDFTQSGAGDATSILRLCELSGGRIRIIPELCKAIVSEFGTSRTLTIGYAENRVRPTGEILAADPDFLVTTNTTAAAGGTITGSSFLDVEVEVLDRLLITATVAGGTIPDGATVRGRIAFLPMT